MHHFKGTWPLVAAGVLLALTGGPEAGAAGEPALRVQVGDHPGYSRIVVRLPSNRSPQVKQNACGGHIVFDEAVAWPLDRLNATHSRRINGYRAGGGGRAMEFDAPCGSRIRGLRERNMFIVDVADPPAPDRKPDHPALRTAGTAVATATPAPAAVEPPPPASPVAEVARILAPVAEASAQPLPPAAGPPVDLRPTAVPEAPPQQRTPAKAKPPAGDLERAVRASVERTLLDLERTPRLAPPKPGATPPAEPARHAPPPPPRPIGPFDFAAWAGDDFRTTRTALEQAVNAAQGAQRVDASIALARFHLARAMLEEGRGALESAGSFGPTADQRFQLSVLADAFRTLDGTADPAGSLFATVPPGNAADHHVWRAATLAPTRWSAAKEGLPIALRRLLSYPADLRNRLLLVLAEAASVDDAQALNMIIMEMITVDGAASADGQIRYFRGRLSELQKQPDAALDHYGHAAESPGPFGRRAQVRSVELRRGLARLDDAGAIRELEALRYAWRGDSIETEALAALGDAYTRAGRTEAALDVFGMIAQRFGATARGLAALGAGRTLLDAVVTALEDRPPDDPAALGLHVRYGALIAKVDKERPALRRRLARLLTRGGFTVEAARSLHALAEEAQGEERAGIGADLAQVLVAAGRGAEALEVLARTAAPGGDTPALAEERALLRAEALADEGDTVRAIDAVRGLTGTRAMRARARILFQAGEWTAARSALADLVERDGNEEVTADDVAHYGLAAFRAGEPDLVRAAADRHRARLAGTRWDGLLTTLAAAPEAGSRPLKEADIARHLAAADATAGIVGRWRTAR
ncbi:hypothetical protein [Azospirillum sp. TSO22-1]|uniref:hypothetical protein n=1 Tax=Azospirillum sp. TSO22-1 TaxID=716789 RepID=UPI000D617CE3|nr:hypothetical protein [Azospirillum sp. TSO22-1]PWC42573.1 hypothetical protein TSO221_21405 [Azospirillum sp. TSO22-1]